MADEQEPATPAETPVATDGPGMFQALLDAGEIDDSPEPESAEGGENESEGADPAAQQQSKGEPGPDENAPLELPETLDGLAEALGLTADDLSGKIKVKVQVDGETLELPLKDALAGHRREADYTKKTQAIADDRRAFDAERAAFANERRQSAEFLRQLFQNVQAMVLGDQPDPSLLDEGSQNYNPAAYMKAERAFRDRMGKFREAQGKVNGAIQYEDGQSQERRKAVAAKERELLVAKLPDFGDPVKGKQIAGDIRDYALSEGFSAAEIGANTDHRVVVVLNKARQWDAAQKKGAAATKKVPTSLPKFAKPGAKEAGGQQKPNSVALVKQLQRSSHGKNAGKMKEALFSHVL
jgi:hypothetical protein